MISLKDYAQKNNISYEAVRKQVVRYKDELGEHLIKQDKVQFLDEVAEAFLNEKRAKNPVVVLQMDKDERIQELEQDNKKLLVKVAEQADKISELSDWKAENAVAIADVNQKHMLLEEKSKAYNQEKTRADSLYRENLELKIRLEYYEKKRGFKWFFGKEK